MSDSSTPRFSVVMPTRERPHTLRYALETCLAQSFEDYEVVVCDNCSTPATREIVESFDSPLVRYVRSDTPLAMSDNWELAVSRARGEFVTIVGDDDGLLPDALSDIDRVLCATGTRCLRWDRARFTWPDIPVEEGGGILNIPLTHKSEMLDARRIIRDVANVTGKGGYMRLPMPYNGAIGSDLIKTLRDRTGRVFAAQSPDVYAGFVFAYLAGSYVSLGRPVAITGKSAKSNGYASLTPLGDTAVARDFRALNESAGMRFPTDVPDVPAFAAAVAECFTRAKGSLFPDDGYLSLDRKRLIANCVKQLAAREPSSEEWDGLIAELRRSMSSDPGLLAWFEMHSDRWAVPPPFDPVIEPIQLGFDGDTLCLDATRFGATDVMGATRLTATLVGPMAQVPPLERPLTPYKRLRGAARIVLRGA